MKFGFSRPVVSEERMFENVDTYTTYVRQRPTYTISSPVSPRLR